MEAREKQICFVLMVVLLASGTLVGSVSAQPNVSKVTQKRCENLYLKYKDFGIDEFKKRYSNHRLLNVCLTLFDDPSWDFKGKSKIDKYYEQLNKNISKPSSKFDVSIKIEKKYPLGQEQFLIKFISCSNDHISKPNFLISSDSEKFLGKSSKHISKGVCQSNWTQIFVKNPSTILVQFIEDTSEYPTIKIKRI